MARILVAEDDASANKLISAVLRRDNHEVLSAVDGQDALDVLDHEHVDLIVSDVMMPRVDGLELVRQLREAGWDTPILMLTARQDAETLHGGFIAGVDDYLTKPADMKELVLRVRALLRRSGAAEANRLVIGAAVLDANRNTIERGGEKVELPSKEFQLLFRLLSTPGRAYTRMQLLDEVWGWDTESSEATVNVHVNRRRDHGCMHRSRCDRRGADVQWSCLLRAADRPFHHCTCGVHRMHPARRHRMCGHELLTGAAYAPHDARYGPSGQGRLLLPYGEEGPD